MGKLTLNLRNKPKDEEYEIPPYGLFLNRHVYDVPTLEEDIVIGEEAPANAKVLPWPKGILDTNDAPVSQEEGPANSDSDNEDPNSESSESDKTEENK